MLCDCCLLKITVTWVTRKTHVYCTLTKKPEMCKFYVELIQFSADFIVNIFKMWNLSAKCCDMDILLLRVKIIVQWHKKTVMISISDKFGLDFEWFHLVNGLSFYLRSFLFLQHKEESRVPLESHSYQGHVRHFVTAFDNNPHQIFLCEK